MKTLKDYFRKFRITKPEFDFLLLSFKYKAALQQMEDIRKKLDVTLDDLNSQEGYSELFRKLYSDAWGVGVPEQFQKDVPVKPDSLCEN